MKSQFIYSVLITLGILAGFSSCSSEEGAVENHVYTAKEMKHGEELFNEVCTKCHRTSPPQNKEDRMSMLAPPIMGVMFHVTDGVRPEKGEQREKVIDFIVDYAHNPSAEKSFCEKHAIERFGVMPTQKDNITKKELTLVANFLYETYAEEEVNHDELQKQMEEN